MRGFWTNICIAAAVIALPGFVLVMWVSPFLDYEFFCKGENSCFREWVSALSGWVAALAALMTVMVMQRHHRDGVRFQTEPLYHLSRLIIEDCNEIALIVRNIEKQANSWGGSIPSPEQADFIASRLQVLKGKLQSAVIAEFEMKVGQRTKDSNIALARASVDIALDHAAPLGSAIRTHGAYALMSIRMTKDAITRVVQFCNEYTTGTQANALSYRREWESFR